MMSLLEWNTLLAFFIIVTALVALDRTCRFTVHYLEGVHFTQKGNERQCKGLEQVSATLYFHLRGWGMGR